MATQQTVARNGGPLGPEPPPPAADRHIVSPVARALAGLAPASASSEATKIEQQRAIAEVQAMVVVAQRAPRDVTKAIARAKESCSQMGLAERAFFKFPRGGQTVSGESIHLAVDLARCWGNITYGIQETDRDDVKARSEMIAYAWDLETNTRASTSFIVPHKRDKRGGAEVLTELRDIYENNANMGARRLREMIFRVLPPWLTEDAAATCMETLKTGGGDPLPKRIAKCIDLYASIGVARDRIEAVLGFPADRMTPTDLAKLGVTYKSIERGEITAAEEFPELTAKAVAAALRGEPKPAAAKPEVDPETGDLAGDAPYQAAEQSTNETAGDPPPPVKPRWITGNGKTVPFLTVDQMVATVVEQSIAKMTAVQARDARARNKEVLAELTEAGHGESMLKISAALAERERA